MGQPRELMDRVTQTMLSKDFDSLRDLYAPDVVGVTPDAGTLHGVDELIEYFKAMDEAFPDMSFEAQETLEIGDFAIDAGYFLGTQTGPIAMPDGQLVPPTGKHIRVRDMELATVRDGRIVRHEWYWDQMESLTQLGLIEAAAPTTT